MNKQEARKRRAQALRDLKSIDQELVDMGEVVDTTEYEGNIIDVEVVEENNLSTEPPMNSALPVLVLDNGKTKASKGRFKQWTEDWWQHAKPEVKARRCVAHKKSGARCLKAAIDGATVCRVHGGAAPHVRAAARARIENAQDRMARELLKMAKDENISDAIRLGAIKDALDRGGTKTPTQVEIGPAKPYEEIFAGIADSSRAQSRARRGMIEPDSCDEIGYPAPAHGEPATAGPPRPPPAAEPGSSSFDDGGFDPLRLTPGHYRRSADRSPGPAVVGDAAIAEAARVNRDSGALPPPKALTSRHRRYRAP